VLGIVCLATIGTARSCVARCSGPGVRTTCGVQEFMVFPERCVTECAVRCGRDGGRNVVRKAMKDDKRGKRKTSDCVSFLCRIAFSQIPIPVSISPMSAPNPHTLEPSLYVRRQETPKTRFPGTYSESSIPHPSICSIHLARQHFSE
jgi:hypothetical protein